MVELQFKNTKEKKKSAQNIKLMKGNRTYQQICGF